MSNVKEKQIINFCLFLHPGLFVIYILFNCRILSSIGVFEFLFIVDKLIFL